jgi:single-stranded DNA-binding protein
MSVNLVVQSGTVKNLALRYGPDGKGECRFTLLQVDNGFTLFLPCCALGTVAERIAEQITEGDHVMITNGRLTYRKRETKLGEQARMEILVWSVEILTTSPQAARSDDAEGDHTSDVENSAPEPKPRRRGYPKAALQGGFAPHAN